MIHPDRDPTPLVLDVVTAHYFDPEAARAMAAAVRARRDAGAYASLDGPALCAALTGDLRTVRDDRHLTVVWRDEPRAAPDPEAAPAAADDDHHVDRWRERFRREAQGVARVECLDGNIGLIELRGLADPDRAGAAYGAAFTLLADTDALIVDLRANRGGWPEAAALFCGYLFGPEPVRLNDVHSVDGVRQFWTPAHLPAPRYLHRPVYALTSPATFSAGEDVAYTLRAHGRARIVGEPSAGAARAFTVHPATRRIDVFVPSSRLVNSVTGDDWEGTGVRPDLAVPAERALDRALDLAREAATA